MEQVTSNTSDELDSDAGQTEEVTSNTTDELEFYAGLMEEDLTNTTDELDLDAGHTEDNTTYVPPEEDETAEPEEGTCSDATWEEGEEEEEEEPTAEPQEQDEEEPTAEPHEQDEEETSAAALGPREETTFDFKEIGATPMSKTHGLLTTAYTQSFKNWSKDHYFQQQMKQRQKELDFKLQQRRSSNIRQMFKEQIALTKAKRDLERPRTWSQLGSSSFDSLRTATMSMEEIQSSDGQCNQSTDHDHTRTEEKKDSEFVRPRGMAEGKDNEGQERLSQTSRASTIQFRHEAGDKEKSPKQSKGSWFTSCFKTNTKNKSPSS